MIEKVYIIVFKSYKKIKNIFYFVLIAMQLDKFYTSPSIAELCCDLVQKHISIGQNDVCIEPSAGNGSFIKPLKKIFSKCYFYDIEPEHISIKKQNFLTIDPTKFIQHNVHIIGNPPFGNNSSLAIKFIKKSTFASTIAFILPRSFKKNSMKRFFPPNFHLISEYDLPKNSFLHDNEIFDVNCVFQIWQKKSFNRPMPVKLIPKGYVFVNQNSKHHISIKRVGHKSGEISKNTSQKSKQTHYFIRFDKFDNSLYQKLNNMVFETKYFTSGPKSISKQDIIKKINYLLVKA